MGDLRNQIESLSPAEKVELLDALWESLEADAPSLTERNGRNWTATSRDMSKIHPM
jgi:hypothetical protein